MPHLLDFSGSELGSVTALRNTVITFRVPRKLGFQVNQDIKWKYFSLYVTWVICITIRESTEYIKEQVFVSGGESVFLANRNAGTLP
jgi:hypothetical protein